jgi:hypothetical protein
MAEEIEEDKEVKMQDKELKIEDNPPEEKTPEKESSELKPIEKNTFEEEPSEKEPSELESSGKKTSEEETSDEGLPQEKIQKEESSGQQPPMGRQTEEKTQKEISPKFEDIKGYDAEELKKEIEGIKLSDKEEKSPEFILSAIQEERRRLQEEREKFRLEMEQKELMLKKKEVKEEEEEPRVTLKSKAIKSFVKERRKRKELGRIKDYLFYGEYALIIVLVMALLYLEGTSFNPVYLPIESSVYLIIVFFLILKVENFYFRYLNMKYSGTVQRKAIGVEHFTAIEYPSMMLNVFVVAILLIPITSMIVNVVIDMISFDREYIPFSSGFTFNLAMLFLASLIISIAWLVLLIRYRNNVILPEMEKIAEPFIIEDVFLITNSGLLLSHITKESKPDVDDDILSSMLTAVKEFVKDSFGSKNEEGELDELQYGKTRVIIEYGKQVYLAAVVRGQESMELRPEMKRILKQIHRKFGRVFDTWDGDLGQLKGIDRLAHSLVEPA